MPMMVEKQEGVNPNAKEEMEALQQCKANMKQAQVRMRHYVNIHRRILEFKEEGDMVFLRRRVLQIQS